MEPEARVPPPPKGSGTRGWRRDLGPEAGVAPLWIDRRTPVETLPSRCTTYKAVNRTKGER